MPEFIIEGDLITPVRLVVNLDTKEQAAQFAEQMQWTPKSLELRSEQLRPGAGVVSQFECLNTNPGCIDINSVREKKTPSQPSLTHQMVAARRNKGT